MGIEKVNKVSEVFGVSRELPLNYVERSSVDDKFISDLALDKHVIIYGSSKQGKTSLRKHCLKEDDFILVQCQNGWGLEKLAEGILKEAGYSVHVSTEKTVENRFKIVAKISSKLKALGFGEASAEVSSEADSSEKATKYIQPIAIDPADPNDLASALGQIDFQKFIVLEDFHYLPQETQENYAFFLKTLHERSSLCFIIVAVWREENRLILFNGDLTGRLVSVDADDWKLSELREVINAGEDLLNISFPDKFKDELIAASLGSVYIVQECCRKVCDRSGIVETQDELSEIEIPFGVDEVVSEVVLESGPRYEAFINNFSEGFQSTTLDMYKWILYPILTASIDQLEKGLPYRLIRETLEGVHPEGKSLNPGNVTQALYSVPALQAKKNIKPFVLDYDKSNKLLSVVDRGFLIWLATQDRDEILINLDLPRKS